MNTKQVIQGKSLLRATDAQIFLHICISFTYFAHYLGNRKFFAHYLGNTKLFCCCLGRQAQDSQVWALEA